MKISLPLTSPKYGHKCLQAAEWRLISTAGRPAGHAVATDMLW